MLEIAHNARDTTNYVKCLDIWHNAAILEKVCEVPVYFSRPSAIFEKVREITIPLILSFLFVFIIFIV